MNCNCITHIQDELLKREYGDRKKKILKADLKPYTVIMDGLQLNRVTSSTVELLVEGYKRKVEQQIIHSFCPFCGTKIKKNEEEQTPQT